MHGEKPCKEYQDWTGNDAIEGVWLPGLILPPTAAHGAMAARRPAQTDAFCGRCTPAARASRTAAHRRSTSSAGVM